VLHGVTALHLLDLQLDKGSVRGPDLGSDPKLPAASHELLAVAADLKQRNPTLQVNLKPEPVMAASLPVWLAWRSCRLARRHFWEGRKTHGRDRHLCLLIQVKLGRRPGMPYERLEDWRRLQAIGAVVRRRRW
jgi:hypothetical protein